MRKNILLALVLIACIPSHMHAVMPEIVLRPQMRVEPKTSAINSVDTEELASYFENIVIFNTQAEYSSLPYVVAFDRESTMGSSGDLLYSKGIQAGSQISAYTILFKGDRLIHPVTNENLGFYADAVGNAEVTCLGDVQSLKVINSLTPIEPGMKLIPRIGLDLPAVIDVHLPASSMKGYVLQVDNDHVGVGHFAAAIISLGDRDGVKRGDMFNVLEGPTYARDVINHKEVRLPAETFGKVLIYKTYDKVSLAIVVESDRPVKEGDVLVTKEVSCLEDVVDANVDVTNKKLKCFCFKCLWRACKK